MLIRIILVFIIFNLACRNNPKVTIKDSNELPDRSTSSSVRDYESKSMFKDNQSMWVGDTLDMGPRISFQDTCILYYYRGQCVYTYPVKYTGKEAYMFWAEEVDCTYETNLMNFRIEKGNPEIGETFAKFTLNNKKKLEVEYYYSEWVWQYNNSEGYNKYDSSYFKFFPKYFYRVN